MSAYAVGISLMLVALAIFLTYVGWLGVRAFSIFRRAKAMKARPAFLALSALPVEAERINASMQQLAPLGERLDAVARDLTAAAASAAGLMVDIGLVASATEDLLDTLVPSMRGLAHDA
jgi:hypothetical protein